LPIGAPLPAAPPCILQRRLPRTAGDRHGVPMRVRAPQRNVWSKLISRGPLHRFFLHCRRLHGTHKGLTTGIDVHVLDSDLLLPLTAIALQGLQLHRESSQELDR
jgi:hypothetical protein